MSHQHDAKFTTTGTMTIFDNGVHRRGVEYSRAIEIDPKTKKVVWEYKDPRYRSGHEIHVLTTNGKPETPVLK